MTPPASPFRRWLPWACLLLAAPLLADVLISMALGPQALALGPLHVPLRRMQAELAVAAVLLALAVFDRGLRTGAPRLPLVVGLVCFGALMANTRLIGSQDSTATGSLPFMLLREGTVTFDRATWIHERHEELGPYYLVWTPKGVLGMYPLTTGVLATPFYVVAALGRFDPAQPALADLQKTAAAGLTALGVALLFCALRRLVAERLALWATVAYVFGTAVTPVLGQALWQHTGAAFALSAALWAFTSPATLRGRTLWVGLFAGLAAACRPLDGVLMLAVLALLVREGPRAVLTSLAAAAVPLLPVAAYNTWAFGAPWASGYGAVASAGFGGSWPEGVVGLLLSPARGLFVLSPILLFAVVPLARRLPALAVGAAVYTAILARWTWWHGGFAPGQRYLADLLPFLAVGLALGFAQLSSRRLRAVVVVAAVWSVAVNGLLTYAVPPPLTKALVWNLEAGPFAPRAFPPVAYALGWSAGGDTAAVPPPGP